MILEIIGWKLEAGGWKLNTHPKPIPSKTLLFLNSQIRISNPKTLIPEL